MCDMKTIDEQLDEALARVKHLEADATASSTLLSEAHLQQEHLREHIATLTSDKQALVSTNTTLSAENETLTLALEEIKTQRDQLASDLATAKQSLASAAGAAADLAKATDQIGTLTAEIEKLKGEAKTAERIAAERYGAASHEPVPVTPRGDVQTEELVARFKAIADPAEQTAFWRSLTSEQRALILNAQ